jgi:hypothetical protein
MRRCTLFVAFVALLAVTYSRTMESQTGAVRQLAPGVWIDLSKHGDFAADAQQNQSAIRQVSRKAPG